MAESYFNHVTLLGYIGNDPQQSFVKISGLDKQVCNFTLYVNNDPFQITAWDNIAKFVFQWKKKGDKVLVDGTIKVKTYTNKDTNKEITEVQVTAKEVTFL
jgi:single-stranded DNA-binding protein